MSFKLITAPTTTPISLSEAKGQCRVESSFTDDDAMIMTYIQSATSYVERLCNSNLMTATWDMYLDCWEREISIKKHPVQSITSVKYFDSNGDEQTLSSSLYSVDVVSDYARILFNNSMSFPSLENYKLNAITIRFVAGFASSTEVPYEVKNFLLAYVRQMYDRQDMSVEPSRFVMSLLDALPFSV